MLEKCVLTILELNLNQRSGHKNTKLNICRHMLTSSTQLQNRSFHVVERTTTSSEYQKMKNARAKILFFIVKYANLWGFSCRLRTKSSLFSAWPWVGYLPRHAGMWVESFALYYLRPLGFRYLLVSNDYFYCLRPLLPCTMELTSVYKNLILSIKTWIHKTQPWTLWLYGR